MVSLSNYHNLKLQFDHAHHRFCQWKVHIRSLGSSAVTDLRFVNWNSEDCVLVSVLTSSGLLRHFALFSRQVESCWMITRLTNLYQDEPSTIRVSY